MSESAPKPAPPRGLRLAYWLTLYLLAAGIAAWMFHDWGIFLIFPQGIGFLVLSLIAKVAHTDDPLDRGALIDLGLSYGTYLSHLCLSLYVRTRKAFVILMALFVVLLALNLATCALVSQAHVENDPPGDDNAPASQ